jgi:GINS complex subunit 2
LGEILLQAAPDDFEDVDQVRRLMRDLREVRMAKVRAGVDILDAGGGVKMNGVGGLEVCEGRGFITGVIDGLRYVVLCLLYSYSCAGLDGSDVMGG